MIKQISRIIIYGLLLLITGFCLWFFHGFFFVYILAVLIILPVFSIFATRHLADKLSLELESPTEYMHRGDSFQVAIQLINPLWYGLLGARLYLIWENTFYGLKGQQQLTVPIRGKRGQRIIWPVSSDKCGKIKCTVDRVELQDLLGIYKVTLPMNRSVEIDIMPKGKAPIESDLYGYQQGMQEVEEGTKKGSDFSEVTDVREYQPGDRLQNIHWKLSVKRDMLMVKERISLSARQLFLFVELHDNAEGLMEEVLDCVYDVAEFLRNQGQPMMLVWWSKGNHDFIALPVDQKEQLFAALERMYYDELYEEVNFGQMMYRQIHGENSQFLWIGNRNGTDDEPLTEYGKQVGVFYGIIP